MPECLTLGETMAAFTPDRMGPLRYVQNYGIRVAGAESNTAVGLAKLGISAAWVSCLGMDEFGQYIRNQLRAEGVDCSGVKFDPIHRTGVMFKQTSSGETSVFYYRADSAASHLEPEDLDEAMLRGCRILHLSGITPVLSESCRRTVEAAIEMAKRNGVKISFDPNIRKKLWKDTDFTPMLQQMTRQAEIVLMGLDEAETLFGTRDVEALCSELFTAGSAEVVALKDGGNGAWIADKNELLHLDAYPCRCIDPIGAGDGFNAGVLAGLLQGRTLAEAGQMGAICGALATEVPGDVEATRTPRGWTPSCTGPRPSTDNERGAESWICTKCLRRIRCWPSCAMCQKRSRWTMPGPSARAA